MSINAPNGEPGSNFFEKGECKKCGSDKDQETFPCLRCKKKFHITNCGKNDDTFTLMPSSFESFKKVVNKTGKFSTRPGNFRFVCDPCLTQIEIDFTCETSEQVQQLTDKVSTLTDDISEIKDMLKAKSLQPPETTEALSNPVITPSNPWSNTTEVNRIRSRLVVDKSADFDNLNISDTVFNSGIKTHGKFVDSKGNTVIVCDSQKSKANLKEHIVKAGISEKQIKEPKPQYPIISVVGIQSQLDTDAFKTKLMKQNPGIGLLVSEESVFDVVSIKPLRKNNTKYQAFVHVSDDIRNMIKSWGDKLFYEWEKLFVYDQLNVPRCYRCQGYNHFARDCKYGVSCGLCASHEHEYKSCPHREKSDESKALAYCCINCKTAGKPESEQAHPAYSSSCEIYQMKLLELKKSLATTSKN